VHGDDDGKAIPPPSGPDDGKLLGIISIGDLVKEIISEKDFVIGQLERYIAGSRG
jgi:hypothetical protein